MSALRAAAAEDAIRYRKPEILKRIPLDDHAVIEASAGTGKTYTLEHLVVELLVSGKARIDQILVVTFTEKATGELRARVRGLLVKLLQLGPGEGAGAGEGSCWLLDGEARSRIEAALRDFDSATISTIHAFCQRTLTENAFANQRLFSEKLVDGREAFAQAFRDVLREELARLPEDRELLRLWLERSGSVEGLEALLHACLSKRGRLEPSTDLQRIEGVLRDFPFDAADALAKELKAAGLSRPTTLINRYKFLAEQLAGCRGAETIRDRLECLWKIRAKKDANGSWLAQLEEGLEPLLGAGGTIAEVHGALAGLDAAIVPLEALVAARFLPRVRARLEERKRELGLFDFDDMLALVRESLEGPHGDALVKALRERYLYALIDEFQDTDEIQWEVFRKVFFESGRRNILYVIGDPKQAIYGFRGADVDTYLDAKDGLLSAKAAYVPLTGNFRSTAGVIAGYNAILSQRAAEPFFTGRIRYDHPVTCGNESLRLVPGSAAPVHVFELFTEGDRRSQDVILPGLGRRIAEEIRKLTDPREPSLLFDDGKGPRPIQHRDVYILSRTGSEGRRIGAALREAGIPHAYFKQEGLFQTEEAQHLYDLLGAVAEPDDRASRFRAWLTPFFGLRLEDLGGAAELPSSDPLFARLLDWKRDADARRYERLFSRILDESGLVRRTILDPAGDRLLTNYLHLCELLLEEVGRSRCTLRELLVAFRALREERAKPEGESGNMQRLESERDAVQIMTMHASKGLEAAVVFLVGGYADPGHREAVKTFHDEGARIAWVGAMPDRVKQQVEAEARWEDERLLYVALTRAKARLYLTLYRGDGSGDVKPLDGGYQPVDDRLRALHAAGADPAIFSFEELQLGRRRLGEVAEAPRALGSWEPHLPEEADPSPELAKLRAERAGYLITSYSQLRSGHQTGKEADAEDFKGEAREVAGPVPDAGALPGGAATGIFLHELLAEVPQERIRKAGTPEELGADPEVARLFEEEGRRHGFQGEALAQATALVFTALKAPVNLGDRSIDGIANAKRLLREMEFLYPIPESSHPRLDEAVRRAGIALEIRRGFVKGFVDLVFEHDGLVYFGDWKSDLLQAYDPRTVGDHVRRSYELQAQLYSLALVKLLGIHDEQTYDATFGGLLYLFLRGMSAEGTGAEGIHFERPSWKQVVSWEEQLLRREDLGMGGVS